MIITRPADIAVFGYYQRYIGLAAFDDLLTSLKDIHIQTIELIAPLDENILNFRYEPSKWTIKEILGHLIDTERIFAYRALRFARKDQTPLPGFEQNDYVNNAETGLRHVNEILDEAEIVRKATIALFNSFNDSMLDEFATANKIQITPRALGFTILGHEMHHIAVIKERYLSHFEGSSVPLV